MGDEGEVTTWGCSDHGCVWGHRGGMGTNGGCHCISELRGRDDRTLPHPVRRHLEAGIRQLSRRAVDAEAALAAAQIEGRRYQRALESHLRQYDMADWIACAGHGDDFCDVCSEADKGEHRHQLRQQRDAALDRERALREALEKYGSHGDDCASLDLVYPGGGAHPHFGACDCGLQAALAAGGAPGDGSDDGPSTIRPPGRVLMVGHPSLDKPVYWPWPVAEVDAQANRMRDEVVPWLRGHTVAGEDGGLASAVYTLLDAPLADPAGQWGGRVSCSSCGSESSAVSLKFLGERPIEDWQERVCGECAWALVLLTFRRRGSVTRHESFNGAAYVLR